MIEFWLTSIQATNQGPKVRHYRRGYYCVLPSWIDVAETRCSMAWAHAFGDIFFPKTIIILNRPSLPTGYPLWLSKSGT
jgi:hypothetical protein